MVTDLCSSKQQYVRITGDDKPAAVVRSQMMKLTGDHIRYVLQGLHQGTSEIRNMKQYLVSCLYNAPLTIDPYYTAMVNHDMASAEPAAKGSMNLLMPWIMGRRHPPFPRRKESKRSQRTACVLKRLCVRL